MSPKDVCANCGHYPAGDLRAMCDAWREAITQLYRDQAKATPDYAVCLGHRIDVYTRCLFQLESALAAHEKADIIGPCRFLRTDR